MGVWQNGVQIIDNPAIDSVGSASSAIPIDAGSTNFVFRLLETRGSNVFAVKVTDEAGNPFSDVRYALNSCDQSSGTVFSDRVLSPAIAQDFSLRIVRGRPLLTFASPGRFDARVTTLRGQIVHTCSGFGPASREINGLAPGVYLVKVQAGGKRHAASIVTAQ